MIWVPLHGRPFASGDISPSVGAVFTLWAGPTMVTVEFMFVQNADPCPVFAVDCRLRYSVISIFLEPRAPGW